MDKQSRNEHIVFFVSIGIMMIMVVWGIIYGIRMDNRYQEEQRICLEKGGLYVENRTTEPYCYLK